MSLPGKLFVGILEEDNPLKSYFRLKPLLVESEGQYVPYTRHEDYPNDGCIRIVPDKNESYHFKTRMRKLGLFCVVDLRAHPDDNDKIRPNKNFREDSPEQNAYIIYSDVVREPAPDTIFEILPEEARDGVLPPPRTAQVLLKGEALHSERYAWELLPGADDKAQLLPTDQTCPEGSLQVFDLETFKGNRVKPGKIFLEVVENPLIIGSVLGILFLVLELRLPTPIEAVVRDMSRVGSPLMLFLLGAFFRFESMARRWKDLLQVCLGRLVVIPGIFLTLSYFAGFRGVEFAALLTIFSSSTAVSSFTMAQQMGADSELAGNIVMATSVLCSFTLYMWSVIFMSLGAF